MKIIKSYLEGFTSVLKTKKLVLTIYLITFVFALVLAIPFENTIKSEAGSSMAFTSLLKDFDYTVYKDFMNKYSISIQPYLSTAFWMGMFYILFTIFFEGGIFTILKRKEEKYSLINFWGGSTKYFSRFLRLAIYSIIIQVIVALAIYIPLLGFIDSSFSSMASEATAFYIFLTGAIIHILIFIFILVVTDYTKIMIVENEELMPFKTLFHSGVFVIKHFLNTYFLYFLLLIIPILLFMFYFLVESKIGMSSGINIFIIFLIQQLFIWCRVFIKIWILGSEISLYDKLQVNKNPASAEPAFEI